MDRLLLGLDGVIADLYRRGVREFRAGGAIGFDTVAALKVISFRYHHPDARLALILPCRDQDKRWSPADREVYASILRMADSVFYVRDVYTPYCMHERNRALVLGAQYCVAYCSSEVGGTASTLRLARQNGLEIFNLADK